MQQHLIAASAPGDHIRALRAMAAWWNGDKLGLDYVLSEVEADPRPEATAALMCAVLAQYTTVLDWSDDAARIVEIFTEKAAALAAEAG